MDRDFFSKTQCAFDWKHLFCFWWIILSVLLITSCTLLYPRVKFSQAFPEFVAVIAQPGDTFASLASEYLQDSSMGWFIAEFNEISTLSPGQGLIIPLQGYEKGGVTLKGYQTVPVLSYHKFSKNKTDMMTVTEEALEEQMRFLKENGYRVITMDQLFDFLDYKTQIPRKSVVITIDDGWRSTYDIAFPILRKYGYVATLFVYTDLITGSDKTLDWDLIREMAKSGIDIQCHTKTHRNLNRKGKQESFRDYFDAVKKELTDSAAIIERHLKTDVQYLAYPYGDTNHIVVALLEKLGYRGAFTVERGSNPFFVHHYRMNRSMVYGDFSIQDFENNLTVFCNETLQ